MDKNPDVFYKAVVDYTEIGIMVYDNNLRYIYWNPFMERIAGITSMSILGKYPTDIFPYLEGDGEIDLLKRALKGEKTSSKDIEYSFPKTNNHIWYEGIYSPYYDIEGNICGVVALLNDITKRKLAEFSLKESEEKYKELVYNQGEGMAIVDNNENFIFVNPAVEEIFGVPENSLLGKNLKEFLSEKEFNKIIEQTKKRIQGKISNYKFTITRPDKNKRIIELIATPRYSKDGQIVSSFGIVRDVTEKNQREEEFRKANMIVENSPVILFIWNIEDYSIKYISKNICQLGYTQDDFITLGKNILTIIHPEDIHMFMEKNNELILNKISYCKLQMRILSNEGISRWIDIIISPINSEIENITLCQAIVIDVTESKEIEIKLSKSEQKLREELKLKDRFLSIINHDIKAPVFSMDNILEWIEINYNKTNIEKVKELIRVVRDSAHTAYSIIEGLVTWARSTKIENEYNPELTYIKPILDECIKFLNINALKKNIIITPQVSDNLKGYFDTKMITVVIRNLISNALKYSYEKSTIEITARTENNFIEISVIDHGIGITKENQEKLFDIDNIFTTYGTNHEEGTGLGLLLCNNFIKTNKGNIWAVSEEKKGSVFTISLPLNEINPL